MHKVCQRFGESPVIVARTLTVERPVAEVFAYVSDFTNTEEWDPGTVRTTLVSGEGGVGTTYHNVSRFLGRHTELTYVVTEVKAPFLLLLRGENKTVVAHDDEHPRDSDWRNRAHLPRGVRVPRTRAASSLRWRRRPCAAERPRRAGAPGRALPLDSTNRVHDQARRRAHRDRRRHAACLGAPLWHRHATPDRRRLPPLRRRRRARFELDERARARRVGAPRGRCGGAAPSRGGREHGKRRARTGR